MKQAYISLQFFKRILLINDILGFIGIFCLVYWLRIGEWPDATDPFFLYLSVMTFLIVGMFYLYGAYQIQTRDFGYKIIVRTFAAVLTFLLFITVVIFISRTNITGQFGRGVLLGSLAAYFLYAAIIRLSLLRFLLKRSLGQKWLVLMSTEYIADFMEDVLENHNGERYDFLSPSTHFTVKESDHFKHIGGFDRLNEVVDRNWFGVIVALSQEDLSVYSSALMQLRFNGMRPMNLTDYYELKWQKVPVYFLQKSWFVFSEGFQLFQNPMGLRFKRVSDFLSGCLLMVMASPFMLLTFILVKLDSPGPAIYKQVRTGENNRAFTIYKFRSMRVDAEKGGAQWASKNDDRVTRVGKFIRKTRLDELPQIWNVIKGDMSFVGPRPERPEFNKELEKEIPHYQLRHLLKPGVSGWAQVMYPYGASKKDATEKLKYELFYIKNYSILLDIVIIFKTIRVMLGGKGR